MISNKIFKIFIGLFAIVAHLVVAEKTSPWAGASTNKVQIVKGQTNQKRLDRNVVIGIIEEIRQTGSAQLSIPHPQGGELSFNVRFSNLLSKKLQSKHPDIYTLKGFGINSERIRINLTPSGLNAIVFTNNETIHIVPTDDEGSEHVSYFREGPVVLSSDIAKHTICLNEHEVIDQTLSSFYLTS
ncbi:hypothetical protein [Reichenbachiella versicolor]|uniref:hypothetical protein n=1 Tax=Reichenbachiella versicolor TaxID=1821036 RepID=UPI000D6E77E2|nr:hypothetical protein [Reichenbachiella versicolor]